MEQIETHEAKTRLSELLARVRIRPICLSVGSNKCAVGRREEK